MTLNKVTRYKMSVDAVPWGTRVAYVLAPALVFMAPFLSFLNYQDYDLTSSEAFYAGGIILAVGILLGAILALRPHTLGQILLVACVLVSLDMGFSSFQIHALVRPDGSHWSVLIWHWALVIGLLVGARVLYRHFSVIMLTVFTAACGAAIVIPGPSQTRGVVLERAVEAKTSKGLIIHLVLDEFMGIEGIPTDIAGGKALREDLKQFFLESGFQLHGGAFSYSSETQHAVAALLNGQFFPTKETAFERLDGTSTWQLRRNAWFEQMAADGYTIQVFENTYAGYCEEENVRIELCEVFPANSVNYLENLELSDQDKAKVILSAFIELSSVTESLRDIAKLPLYRLGPFFMEEALGRVGQRAAKSKPGQLMFAHILSPHYSYVYEADCEVKLDGDTWINRYLPFRDENEAINTPNSRMERYQAYFAQARCTQRQLQAFFGHLRSTGRYDEATIIVHGDHGSRISIWNPVIEHKARLSDRDIIDNFSVLYAVKQPGVSPAYKSAVRSIQALFAETFLNKPLHVEPAGIFLRGGPTNDGDLLRKFPDFGT